MTLQYVLSFLVAVLAVPYILPLVCQITIKCILFPLDIYYYGGKCTFNTVEAQNTLQLMYELENPGEQDHEDPDQNVASSQIPALAGVRSWNDLGLLMGNSNAMSSGNIYLTYLDFSNIRINQVAASIASSQNLQVDNSRAGREQQLNGSRAQSPGVGERPFRQRLLLMDRELWMEVKQNTVEYSLDLAKHAPSCSICLADFNTRQKDENIAGDSVIPLECNAAHIFHAECLKEWVKFQFTCPICREILLKDKSDQEKLKRYMSIVRRNTLIQYQNDDDNDEAHVQMQMRFI